MNSTLTTRIKLHNMLSLSQIFWRFRLAIYLYWAMSAAFLGYWTLYFQDQRAISESNIGLMMSVYTLSALIGQNVFGYLSDKLTSLRIPVAIAAGLLVIVLGSFPLVDSLRWVYPCMAVVGFLQQPIGPMLDSWTLKHLGHHHQQPLFGRIRGFGSLGWASTALMTAYLVEFVSWNMMFIVAQVAAILLCLTSLIIPDAIESQPEATSPTSSAVVPRLTIIRAIKYLFGNGAYLYILIVIFFMYLGVQTTFNFQGLLIKDTGGGVRDLGWTFFVGVMAEIPAMFASVWLLSRMAPRKLMVISGCLYMLRYGLIIYFQTPGIIMATAILEGLAFGLLLTALRNYIFTVVDTHVQTSAMTVMDAVFLSFTVIVGGAVGGWLIEHYSAASMLVACMCSSGLALALLLAGGRVDRHHTTSTKNSELSGAVN
ncbi:MAG: MFS transporter [Pirellulaceae bacterium]|nr:MFS transporter [Pirellulaceae bacterium]